MLDLRLQLARFRSLPTRSLIGGAVLLLLGLSGTAGIFAATRSSPEPVGVRLALPQKATTTLAPTTLLDPPTTTSEPAGAPSTTASPTTVSVGRPGDVAIDTRPHWRRVSFDVSGERRGAGLVAVARVTGQGFVAVGAADDGPVVAGSADGERWFPLASGVTTFGAAQLRDVVVTPDGLVIVGSAEGRPAAWRSSDGVEWHALEVDGRPRTGFFATVTADRSLGVVTAGFTPGAAPMWRLADATFRPVASSAVPDASGTLFTGLAGTGGAVVALGNDGSGRAIGWTWRGDDAWERSVLSAEASAAAVAVVGNTVVGVGYDGAGARAWTTTDGRAWAAAGSMPGDVATIVAPLGLASAGERVLAVGQRGIKPLCWWTDEGRDWRGCTPDDATGLARDVVAIDADRFVVVGRAEEVDAGPAVWIVEWNITSSGGRN